MEILKPFAGQLDQRLVFDDGRRPIQHVPENALGTETMEMSINFCIPR
jgi:hypothetical protein